MSAELVESPIVWQVALRQSREQAHAEHCLRERGFSLLEGNAVPPDAQIGTVTAAFTITPAELETLKLLLAWDSAREVAGALHESERTVEKHPSRLEAKLQVHSCHRVLLGSLDVGLLRLLPGLPGGRLSLETSRYQSVLQVVARDAAAIRAVAQCLATADFPVLLATPPRWEVAPPSADLPVSLTPRERAALEQFLRHDRTEAMAQALGVTAGAVGFHLNNLKQRCGGLLLRHAQAELKSRADLSPSDMRSQAAALTRGCHIHSRTRLLAVLIALGVVRRTTPGDGE